MKKNVRRCADGSDEDLWNTAEKLSPVGNGDCYVVDNVDITLISTLTAEDENIIAPAILRAVTNILDHLPIAYRVRIDTVDCQCYMGSGPDRQRLTEDGHFRPSPPALLES
jgi:hypothetical protein